MEYIGSLDNFRLQKDGQQLFVSSYRDGFETYMSWPDGVSVDDDNVMSQIHEKRYIRIKNEYEEFLP